MSELSCDTLFIGRNETHDLSRYLMAIYMSLICVPIAVKSFALTGR